MAVKTYRRKPTTVEAVQWTGQNVEEIRAFVPNQYLDYIFQVDIPFYIHTPHGRAIVSLGDWVVKRAENDFYPCSNKVFVELYEEVPETGQWRVDVKQDFAHPELALARLIAPDGMRVVAICADDAERVKRLRAIAATMNTAPSLP